MDDYGGSIENRARIHLGMLRAVRKAVGDDFPILAKLNCGDFVEGGMRSFETAEKLLDDGTADFISMCRPFIREPALVNRWKSGDRRKAFCKSDNACFKPGMEGKGVYCLTAEVEKGKLEA